MRAAGKVATEEIIKKWLAPAAVGTAAATQSEDSEAIFAGLKAVGANRKGAEAALNKFYDDFIEGRYDMNDPMDVSPGMHNMDYVSRKAGNSRQGWFVGADLAPRFEINDKPATIDKRFNKRIQGIIADRVNDGEEMISDLSRILHHDNLFNAYPEIRDMPLMFARDQDLGGAVAGYMPPPEADMLDKYPSLKNGMISLNVDAMRNGDRANIIDSLLHETQHGIQEIENFSRGANAEWTPDEYLSRHLDYAETAGPKADLMNKHNEDAYRLDADNVKHLGEGARPAHQQALSNFYYMMNAGEAEARAVELRRRLSAKERAERMPWVDYKQWYDHEPGARSIFDFIESK